MVLIPLLLLGIGVALWHPPDAPDVRLCAACLCVLLASSGCSRKGADPVAPLNRLPARRISKTYPA